MLVLTRRLGESIIVNDCIRIQVLTIGERKIRLGITAPEGVIVDRGEIAERRRTERSLQDCAILTSHSTLEAH
jgi:carbon storage regulator